MKKILQYKKIIFMFLSIILILTNTGVSVKAISTAIIDTSKTVSLTITKYEHANGSEDNVELAGVEFTVYSVPETVENIEDAETYIKNNDVTSYTKTTPDSGTITFSGLEQGRYFVVETDAPKNVLKKVESFLIDLPRTSDDGTEWEYDVTVYPKNITIYGTVTVNNTGNDGENLSGTEWILQKLNDDGEWENYNDNAYTSDENGQIILENLEVGEYRLIIDDIEDGYIVDNSDIIEFTIDAENLSYETTKQNEKLNIEKYVLLDSGEYGKDVGKYTTDIVSWKTVADVASIISKMDKYCITEQIDSNLILDTDSLHIYGVNSNGDEYELADDCYTVTIDNGQITIDFVTEKLANYSNVFLTYDTTFADSVKNGEFKTQANLTYTDYIDLNSNSVSNYTTDFTDAEVHTGSVLIWKVDTEKNPLQGAIFKIATSKSNAEKGIFVTDENSNDIIATSDENGYVIFNGLKFGDDNEETSVAMTSYWIVEVQAPSYLENGETKYYSLLDSPVEVQVYSTSGVFSSDNTTTVVNRKNLTLPLTGGTISLISTFLGILIILISVFIIKKDSNKSKGVNFEKEN